MRCARELRLVGGLAASELPFLVDDYSRRGTGHDEEGLSLERQQVVV